MENGVTHRAPAQRENDTREAASDGSRSSASRLVDFRAAIGRTPPPLLAVSVLGVAAGLLMILAEFSTIASVDVASGSCEVINDSSPDIADRCELSGLERHGGALILLGLVAIAMSVGAGVGRSRPAAAALIVIGVVVMGLTFLLDLPETDETGAIGRNFEGAEGSAGTGLYLEAIAGVLAVAAGALRLTRRD